MKLIIPDKIYAVLKYIALYLLPGFASFWLVISGIWGIPYGEQIVATIVAVNTFLSVLLGISTYQYNKLNQ